MNATTRLPRPASRPTPLTAGADPPPPAPVMAFAVPPSVACRAAAAPAAVATPPRGAAVAAQRPRRVAACRRRLGAGVALPRRGGGGATTLLGGAARPRLLRCRPDGGGGGGSAELPPPPPGHTWVVIVEAAADGVRPAPPTGPGGDGGDGGGDGDEAAAPRRWWAPIAPVWAAVKKAGFVLGLATGLAVSGVVLFAPDGGGDGTGVAAIREKTTLFEYILTDLQRGYVEEVDMNRLFEAGVEGMLGTLDPYTSFESVAEARELSLKTAGKCVGGGESMGCWGGDVAVAGGCAPGVSFGRWSCSLCVGACV